MKLRINHLFHNFLKINMYFWPDMKVLLHLLDKPLLKKKKKSTACDSGLSHGRVPAYYLHYTSIICRNVDVRVSG